ncbi:hypothetical protein KCMC57_up58100 [Kitasatospora sp. CMC57]|uniref:Uncharacterized protein n=1 Tax=Kitasatospora sp. CMC57 TaxID=3231513 RepID=A0AB33K1M3_9ACTN
MSIKTTIGDLIEDAERQIRDGAWVVREGEQLLARRAAEGLTEAIDVPADRQSLPDTLRLEDLREALAVLAITLARTHGHLAWFLGGASTALSAILQWRSLPAAPGYDFHTTIPTPDQYTDAEEAVTLLHDALLRIAT